MKDERIFLAESAQKSAEYYNFLIWTVFSVAVALSLWILFKVWPSKANFGPMYFLMSFLGFCVLFYGILAIESFGQKKSLMYQIFNTQLKKSNFSSKIGKLPFFRFEWLAEFILLFIFILYIRLFWFIWAKKSLEMFGESVIFLALPFFVVSLLFLSIILCNWILRPKSDNGNFLEKIRKFIFGNWLKSYNKIVGN